MLVGALRDRISTGGQVQDVRDDAHQRVMARGRQRDTERRTGKRPRLARAASSVVAVGVRPIRLAEQIRSPPANRPASLPAMG